MYACSVVLGMHLKRAECLTDKINEPETKLENGKTSITDCVAISGLEKIYTCVIYMRCMYDKGDLLAGSHTALSRWKNCLSDVGGMQVSLQHL
jgi:hypothetical protein